MPPLDDLRHADRFRRAVAARELGKARDRRAVPLLCAVLEDPDSAVRQHAALALGRIGDPQAVPPLCRALGDPEMRVRARAAEALAALAVGGVESREEPRDEEAWLRLGRAELLAGTGELLARERLEALRDLRNSSDEGGRAAALFPAVLPLIDGLSDSASLVRSAAARALLAVGAPAVPALCDALAVESRCPRAEAARLLGEIGDGRAVPALSRALTGTGRRFAVQAAEALGRIGDAAAIPALGEALRNGDGVIRFAAARALCRLGPAAAPHLRRAAMEGDVETRCLIVEALGEFGDRGSVPLLTRLFQETDDRLRRSAAQALGRIGDGRAVRRLRTALEDVCGQVREAAAEALGRIAAVEPSPELREVLPLLKRRLALWSGESGAARETYRSALARIEAATADIKDLPVPGRAPAGAPDEFPIPAAGGVREGELPLPGADPASESPNPQTAEPRG